MSTYTELQKAQGDLAQAQRQQREQEAARLAPQQAIDAAEARIHELRVEAVKEQIAAIKAGAARWLEGNRSAAYTLEACIAKADLPGAIAAYADVGRTYQLIEAENTKAIGHVQTLAEDAIRNPDGGIDWSNPATSQVFRQKAYAILEGFRLDWGVGPDPALAQAIGRQPGQHRQIAQGIGYAIVGQILDPAPDFDAKHFTARALPRWF